jgi:hypothetical protein
MDNGGAEEEAYGEAGLDQRAFCPFLELILLRCARIAVGVVGPSQLWTWPIVRRLC